MAGSPASKKEVPVRNKIIFIAAIIGLLIGIVVALLAEGLKLYVDRRRIRDLQVKNRIS